MSSLHTERQIRPIYDALDSGSHKSALVACNKLLKKHPKNDHLKALKALALTRAQKFEEAIVLCEEVLSTRPTDDGTMNALMHALRHLGRFADLVKLFEDAFKQQPENDEFGRQAFFANVRMGNWKAAQQLANKLNKQFHNDRYVFWGIMCTVLQANDPMTAAEMRNILLKLAHRLITASWKQGEVHPDRLHLHTTILQQLGLHKDARELLDTESGRLLCARNISCDYLRREIMKAGGWQSEEGITAEERVVEKRDRNWLEFVSILDATFLPSADHQLIQLDPLQRVAKTRDLFTKIAEEDGSHDRSAWLGLMELERLCIVREVPSDPSRLLNLLKRYFEIFGDKAACYEDLRPYSDLYSEVLSDWIKFLEGITHIPSSGASLRRSLNAHKLLRYGLSAAQLTVEQESVRAAGLEREYFDALPLGKDIPNLELQPADDLAILAAQVHVNMYALDNAVAHLHNAVVLLEYASKKSPQSYQIHLELVRIYRRLGAPQLALDHYRLLNVKQVQNDTMSHLILSRATNFSLAATGDLAYASQCLEASHIYFSNSQDTSEFIVKAFGTEKYSQIPELVVFEERLDNSLQRDLVKIEHVRLRISHEQITSELVDMELIELKFIFDRLHHDNRDLEVLPNYQPRGQPSFLSQTTLFGNEPAAGWLSIFLKIYIKALSGASDLDLSVEDDKLLVGDRPRPRSNPDAKISLTDRLTVQTADELSELTDDEVALFHYVVELTKWLDPFHNFLRPRVEAAKQPPKSSNSANDGVSENGHGRKPDDTPHITEPPDSILSYFKNARARFTKVVEETRPIYEILHIATLAQEALFLFFVCTKRFKDASVVRINKLGVLVQHIKSLRASVIDIVREIGTQLTKISELEGTADKRRQFVEHCKALQTHSELTHEYVLDVGKRVTDSQKKVLEGVGSGIVRVCKTPM
ncbi:N-acetyltransferase B complex non catalytic subunit-domain-containing protein [Russula earlei]|uniref:N-acetyltransferase B complex non catalytic subunit-domain-containing protein n=1 Tax=Russula earlei TaxID=71964 RepID=A0ACC0UDR1_9AGAM|nr:N-acetyltransferase B complex non catalytic subunit-domain-containing protein [Russula earlei]